MQLLCQLNFAELSEQSDLLPKKGLLQFFISAHSEYYGVAGASTVQNDDIGMRALVKSAVREDYDEVFSCSKKLYRSLLKRILSLGAQIFVLSVLLSCASCVTFVKDGGTVVYNSGAVKIIDWHTLEGKKYRETHIFPMSLFPLDHFNYREEKDFERLLKSAFPQVLTAINGYLPLDSSCMNDQPKVKKCYNTILNYGMEVNYYLIQRMICDEPTMFCLPNIVCPLTDGDIAFMLLCDINCKDEYEQRLFPAELISKPGYSAADMFSYLHESRENRIAVALRLLDEYIKDEDIRSYFRVSCKEEMGDDKK